MGAFDGVVTAPVAGRTRKPRHTGLTAVMDKGLGLEATRDVLSVAGAYIDFCNRCPKRDTRGAGFIRANKQSGEGGGAHARTGQAHIPD